jgi:hypothetical protein
MRSWRDGWIQNDYYNRLWTVGVKGLWYSNKAQLAGRTNLGINSWDQLLGSTLGIVWHRVIARDRVKRLSVRVTSLRYITGV